MGRLKKCVCWTVTNGQLGLSWASPPGLWTGGKAVILVEGPTFTCSFKAGSSTCVPPLNIILISSLENSFSLAFFQSSSPGSSWVQYSSIFPLTELIDWTLNPHLTAIFFWMNSIRWCRVACPARRLSNVELVKISLPFNIAVSRALFPSRGWNTTEMRSKVCRVIIFSLGEKSQKTKRTPCPFCSLGDLDSNQYKWIQSPLSYR